VIKGTHGAGFSPAQKIINYFLWDDCEPMIKNTLSSLPLIPLPTCGVHPKMWTMS